MPSLYDVLGLTAAATQAEIKKAYHGMALRLHPDKNPGDESAHEKFQSLQRVYAVLGDPEKRKVYDETGVECGTDGLSGEQFDSLYKYYREIYAEVTVDDIERYEQTYRGSDEEAHDLRELYTRFGGDMNEVFSWLCCSRPDVDSHRFMELLQRSIDSGELKKSKAFDKWAKQVARKPAPRDPLAPASSGAAGRDAADSSKALVAAIKGRSEQAKGLVDALEAKYGGARTKKQRSEPTEEDFAAAQDRLQQRKRR